MMISGTKIEAWDEVKGIKSVDEDYGTIVEQIAEDNAAARERGTGPVNYLKSAEEQIEDDYNSIDGIVNNGSRREIENDQKTSVMEKLREYDAKVRKEAENIRETQPDRVKLCQCYCPERGIDI